jgi:hypothetical protein
MKRVTGIGGIFFKQPAVRMQVTHITCHNHT